MKRSKTLRLAALLTLSTAAVAMPQDEAPQPAVHLFILSGQSNMEGLDPARTFTPAVTAEFGAGKVVVVKDARGGEPIHRWFKGWQHDGAETPKRRGALYDRLMKKVRAATLGQTLLSVTFVWMQGERDARQRWGQVYRKSLRGVVEQLSADLSRTDIHCVIGRLSDFDMTNQRYRHWTMVRDAQVAFAEKYPRGAWVNTDDLNDGLNRRGKQIQNDLHLSVEGYDTLGRRFARKAIDLIKRHRKPNIILVMADDQGWGDTGYNGHPFVKTPTMDAMAKSGFVFDRFYASAPVCSPTRAGVLTGRHPIRCNVPNHGRYLRPHENTIGEALRPMGYVTGMFGKYHLGSGQPDSPANPGAAGFDEWVIGLNFFDNNPYLSRNGTVEHRKGKGSVLLVDDAIAFLEKHAQSDQPVFAVVWFPSPHDPHREVPAGEGGDALYGKRKMAAYYREITLLDQQLGRLRAALQRLKIADDTLLWYCSDNGGLNAKTSGGRAKKGSVYEGGLRVPGVVEWPARRLKGRSSVPVNACDIYPTLLTIAGARKPDERPLDGIDITPLFAGEMDRRKKPMGFWHRFQGGRATWSDRILKEIMRKQQAGEKPPFNAGRLARDVMQFPKLDRDTSPGHAAWTDWPWKLHRIDGAKFELYNLELDPQEAMNLIEAPEYEGRVKAMKARLKAWMRSVVDSVNGEDYPERR